MLGMVELESLCYPCVGRGAVKGHSRGGVMGSGQDHPCWVCVCVGRGWVPRWVVAWRTSSDLAMAVKSVVLMCSTRVHLVW